MSGRQVENVVVSPQLGVLGHAQHVKHVDGQGGVQERKSAVQEMVFNRIVYCSYTRTGDAECGVMAGFAIGPERDPTTPGCPPPPRPTPHRFVFGLVAFAFGRVALSPATWR